MSENKPVSKKTKFWLIFVAVLIVLAVGAAAVLGYFVFYNVADRVTVEAGTDTVSPKAYLIRDWEIPIAFAGDSAKIDLNVPGEYPVQLSYCGRIYDAVLAVEDTVSPTAVLTEITAMSYETLAPESFVQEIHDVTKVTVQFEAEPDMNTAGDQTVALLLTDEGGNTTRMETTLTVIVDTTPPVIAGMMDMTIYLRQTPNYLDDVIILDDLDEAPVLTVDDSKVDLTKAGTYEVSYVGRDATGNETVKTVNLTIIEDNEAPAILGVNPISLYEGSTVAYRAGVLVTDDKDEKPTLTVDSSGVDLSKAGTYEVIYKAVDAAGNESTIKTTVTVKEKKDGYVEEQVILDAADAILKDIITADMTTREKAVKVYRWIKSNCSYVNSSDKTDWMQAAYKMIRNRRGDCFSYYSLSRLLLDRLEIPNITVMRSKDSPRRTKHFWSLVSVDGGENYYHYDATPVSKIYKDNNFCLVTDDYLEGFNKLVPGYYTRDMSLYPATPKE